MKIKGIKKIKKDTTIFTIFVICLTMTLVGSSYSIFFDVKTNENKQVIQTGELVVEFGSESTSLTSTYLYPLSDSDGVESSAQSVFYVQNNGSIDAAFTFTITKNEVHELSDNYLKFAIFEYDAVTKQSIIVSDIGSLSDVEINENGEYIIYTAYVEASSSGNNSKTYSIKFWLDESSANDIVGQKVDLSINVNSEVLNSVMHYNINGYVKDSTGTIYSDAVISLNNGSITEKTNSSGFFTLEDLRIGDYAFTITLSDQTTRKGTLTIKEGTSVSTSIDSGYFVINGSTEKTIEYINIIISDTNVERIEVEN